ncbi:MAG: isocitrate lyase/phosphoenolpyruvate mutase family protein [Rhodospirillaceae bacterium]|nr:isocitrate lyase/phosphoenolpyruvate mutase family protein [Rhodospirillaceae bacterium]
MTTATLTQAKRQAFRDLHRTGCFILPNPWDVGSARYLAHLGFKAIATTSSGAAWSAGRPDEHLDVDNVLAHLATMVQAVDLPVNADFEDGHADDIEGLMANVRRACQTGIAGLSIEDSQTGPVRTVRGFDDSVARLRAARKAVDADGGGVLLTGRAEGFIADRPDLGDVLRRLVAFAEAGADCLYAPGLTTDEQVAAVVRAVAPKPVNVLVAKPGFTAAGLAALGVRRISLGGALARVAWGGFMAAAKEIAAHGTFENLAHAANGAELNALMSDALSKPR